jgi:hypothetical protein
LFRRRAIPNDSSPLTQVYVKRRNDFETKASPAVTPTLSAPSA